MATKKKTAKRPAKRRPVGIINVARMMERAPEELKSFWNDEVQDAWIGMRPQQQDFMKEYLTNGNNASEAYRQTYNSTTLAKNVSALAFQVIACKSMQTILTNMSKGKAAIFLVCQNTLLNASEAMKPVFNKEGDSAIDIEDHPTRIKAVSELAKLSGFMVDKTENTVNITKNLTINHNVLADMNQYLGKIGHTPIKQANGGQGGKPQIQDSFIKEDIEDEETFESFGDSSMRVLGND